MKPEGRRDSTHNIDTSTLHPTLPPHPTLAINPDQSSLIFPQKPSSPLLALRVKSAALRFCPATERPHCGSRQKLAARVRCSVAHAAKRSPAQAAGPAPRACAGWRTPGKEKERLSPLKYCEAARNVPHILSVNTWGESAEKEGGWGILSRSDLILSLRYHN